MMPSCSYPLAWEPAVLQHGRERQDHGERLWSVQDSGAWRHVHGVRHSGIRWWVHRSYNRHVTLNVILKPHKLGGGDEAHDSAPKVFLSWHERRKWECHLEARFDIDCKWELDRLKTIIHPQCLTFLCQECGCGDFWPYDDYVCVSTPGTNLNMSASHTDNKLAVFFLKNSENFFFNLKMRDTCWYLFIY